jgi:hypothetical protein
METQPMLVIRSEQLDALRSEMFAPVREKFIALLKRKLPQHTASMSDAELRGLCDRGIAKAERYDLASQYNVYVFVAAMLVIGEDFDIKLATAWSREILRDELMHEDIKAKMIELGVFTVTKTDIAPYGH